VRRRAGLVQATNRLNPTCSSATALHADRRSSPAPTLCQPASYPCFIRVQSVAEFPLLWLSSQRAVSCDSSDSWLSSAALGRYRVFVISCFRCRLARSPGSRTPFNQSPDHGKPCPRFSDPGHVSCHLKFAPASFRPGTTPFAVDLCRLCRSYQQAIAIIPQTCPHTLIPRSNLPLQRRRRIRHPLSAASRARSHPECVQTTEILV
jgi:hypothetical protein